MAWWLEGAISRHFGWVRNPLEAIFCIFLESGKKIKKKKFQEKSVFLGEKYVFIGKNRFLSEKSAIFRRFFFFFRIFHPNIFSSTTEIGFFSEKSTEIGDFFVHGNV